MPIRIFLSIYSSSIYECKNRTIIGTLGNQPQLKRISLTVQKLSAGGLTNYVKFTGSNNKALSILIMPVEIGYSFIEVLRLKTLSFAWSSFLFLFAYISSSAFTRSLSIEDGSRGSNFAIP